MHTNAFVLCLALAAAACAEQDARRDEVLSKLANTKVSLDFRDTTLPDVIDFLRELSGINIVVEPRVYEALDERKLSVTLKLDDLPLADALRLLLGLRDLTAVYRDGCLVVVTKASLAEQAETRLYDVRDILQPVTDFAGPRIDLGTGGEGDSVSPNTFITEDDGTGKPPTPDRLVVMVQDACGPETWGSDKVSIQVSHGVLIVSQSRQVHRAIAEFLNRLRAAR